MENFEKLKGKSVLEIISLWNEFCRVKCDDSSGDWLENKIQTLQEFNSFDKLLFDSHVLDTVDLVCRNIFHITNEFSDYELDIPRGILLYGPPGSGKSSIANYLQSTFKNVTFFTVKITDILHTEIGESEKSIHDIFQLALNSQPSIIFIDEIDGLFSKQTERNDENEIVFSKIRLQFVLEIDALQKSDELFLLAATNMKYCINEELLSCGRFELELEVNYPPKNIIIQYLKEYLSGLGVSIDILQWIENEKAQQAITNKIISPAAVTQLVKFLRLQITELQQPLTLEHFQTMFV